MIFQFFVLGCAWCLLLQADFLWLQWAGVTSCCSVWASHCRFIPCCWAHALVGSLCNIYADTLRNIVSFMSILIISFCHMPNWGCLFPWILRGGETSRVLKNFATCSSVGAVPETPPQPPAVWRLFSTTLTNQWETRLFYVCQTAKEKILSWWRFSLYFFFLSSELKLIQVRAVCLFCEQFLSLPISPLFFGTWLICKEK